MANKKDFLEATDAQIATLTGWLEDIDKSTRANNAQVESLGSQRLTLINNFVDRLVPDVEDTTLRKLERTFPNFMTADDIKRAVTATHDNYASRKATLLEVFNPETFPSQEMTLEAGLDKVAADLDIAKQAFDHFRELRGLSDLIDRHYNTSDYAYGILDGQYYRDWKLGDELVEQSGRKSWESLVSDYQRSSSNYDTINREYTEIGNKLKALRDQNETYQDLVAQEANLDDTVRDKVRTKLQVYLNHLQPLPEALSEVSSIDAQIAKLQGEGTTQAQANRTEISSQLLELQKLRRTAAASRSNEVPDKYLEDMQRRNRYASQARRGGGSRHSGSYGGRGGTNTVYVRDNSNWLLDAMIYNELFNHFDSDRYSSGGYGSHRGYDRDPVYSDSGRGGYGGGNYGNNDTANNRYGS